MNNVMTISYITLLAGTSNVMTLQRTTAMSGSSRQLTLKKGVRSAMHSANQLPGRGPTDVDDAPAPAG